MPPTTNHHHELTRISPAEAHVKMKDEQFTYLDVRSAIEFDEGHPANAVNIPLTNNHDAFVDAVSAKYVKDARIIVGCQTGIRSVVAANLLLDEGFTNVLEQRAGFDARKSAFGEVLEPGWSRVGLPVE